MKQGLGWDGMGWDGMGIKLACMHMLELEGYKYKVVESDTQYWLEQKTGAFCKFEIKDRLYPQYFNESRVKINIEFNFSIFPDLLQLPIAIATSSFLFQTTSTPHSLQINISTPCKPCDFRICDLSFLPYF